MTKLFRLIQNEYIKIMKKLSTKILLILVAVFAIGLVGISKFGDYMSRRDYEMYYMDDDYSYEIEQAKEMKYNGYEIEIDKYQFMSDLNLQYPSWKYMAAIEAFSYNEISDTEVELCYTEEQRSQLKDFIKKDDWKGYCKFMTDYMKADGMPESSYWSFEYCYKNDIPLPTTYDESIQYPYSLVEEIQSLRENLAEFDDMGELSGDMLKEKANMEDELNLAEYRLKNDIKLNIRDNRDLSSSQFINFWSVFAQSSALVSVIGIMLIVVAGGTVATEFSNGTIKFLLINPVKRWKILASKYVTTLLLGLIMMALLYVTTALLSMVVFGTEYLGQPYLDIENGSIEKMNGFLYVAKQYLLSSVSIVVMSTLAFAISSVVRSSSLAIGVSMFAMLSGNTVVLILKEAFHFDWARYLIFANTNLATIMNGESMFSHHSVGFALAVIGVHMFVFLLTAWDGFTRREV